MRTEIIKMAREADLLTTNWKSVTEYEEAIERFFRMAQAAEREACAKVCAEMGEWSLVHQIEARGEE